MKDVAFILILLLATVFAVGFLMTLGYLLYKERRIRRLTDPRKDHYR